MGESPQISWFGIPTSTREATDDVMQRHAFYERTGCDISLLAVLSEALEEADDGSKARVEELEEENKALEIKIEEMVPVESLDCDLSELERDRGTSCRYEEGDCAACELYSEKQRRECSLTHNQRKAEPCKSHHGEDCAACELAATRRETDEAAKEREARIAELVEQVDNLRNASPDAVELARVNAVLRDSEALVAIHLERIGDLETIAELAHASRRTAEAEEEKAHVAVAQERAAKQVAQQAIAAEREAHTATRAALEAATMALTYAGAQLATSRKRRRARPEHPADQCALDGLFAKVGFVPSSGGATQPVAAATPPAPIAATARKARATKAGRAASESTGPKAPTKRQPKQKTATS